MRPKRKKTSTPENEQLAQALVRTFLQMRHAETLPEDIAKILPMEKPALQLTRGKPHTKTIEPRYWTFEILVYGMIAIDRAVRDLAAVGDLRKLEVNLISSAADLVNRHLRSGLLRRCLVDSDWNLTVAAEALGMGHNPASIIREIRRVGLDDEYSVAQKTGRVRRHHRPLIQKEIP